jgi:multiple sugar transport system ATP-binding protein
LGIRPDAFSVEAPAGAGQAAPPKIGVRINLVEPLGDRKDVYMTTLAQKNLVGRVDGRVSVFEGQELSMFVDMDRVHLFEPGELGVNVTASREGVPASGN